ncbi:MAG: hypothetical protein FGM16_06880 [Flavobacterium sp.]|nr:hypothetical protein [Flavobacterium sp.]
MYQEFDPKNMIVTNSFMIDVSTLLAIVGIIVIPGIIAWIAIREKVVRLEERVKIHESGATKIDTKLDQLFDELKELREELHSVRTGKK